MGFSYQRVENLAQALNLATTTSSSAIPFMLATASAALCLWSPANELLNLRPNQISQSKRDEHQVCCHEAILLERKNARGAAEAQVREAHSRDCEPAADIKKHCAK